MFFSLFCKQLIISPESSGFDDALWLGHILLRVIDLSLDDFLWLYFDHRRVFAWRERWWYGWL